MNRRVKIIVTERKLHGSKQPGVKTPLQVLPTILCKTKNSLTQRKKKMDIKVDQTSLVAHTVKRLPTMLETRVRSLDWEDLLQKKWQPTAVFLPGKSHGQRTLAGYSPWGCKESDTTEQLTEHNNMLGLFSKQTDTDAAHMHCAFFQRYEENKQDISILQGM